jgi:hypothetical protein
VCMLLFHDPARIITHVPMIPAQTIQ